MTALGHVNARHVGVLVVQYMPMGHEHLKGVARYVSEHPSWIIHTSPRRGFAPLHNPEDFKGHGLIVHIGSREQAERYRRLPFPVVNIGALVLDTGLPSVMPDNEAIGRCAFWHFWERGFRHLGYCGFRNHGYAILRHRGLVAAASEYGLTVSEYPDEAGRLPSEDSAERFAAEEAEILDWLKTIPRPSAIFAASDQRGRQILEACRRGGIQVPEDVSILGVDDDHVLCLTSQPTLSSIAVPFERIGYEAAALLDRLMAGEKPPLTSILFPPLGVISRGSTDFIATQDRALAAALRFLRENAGRDIDLAKVARAVGLNRRTLERRFRQEIGHTLHDELVRLRLATAKRCLAESDSTLAEVAERAGFGSVQRLCQVFRSKLGITPLSYRQRSRWRVKIS